MRDAPKDPLRRLMGTWRALPLWARWLVTIVGYSVVILAVAVAVRGGGGASGGGSASTEARAIAEANHEGQVAIAEDEAPHTAPLPTGVAAQVALERAIAADVRGRIAHGALTGPLQGVHCHAAGPLQAGRRPFSCTVRSAHISYPFVGVASEHAPMLRWCKVDPPPVAGGSLEVPVSPRCRA